MMTPRQQVRIDADHDEDIGEGSDLERDIAPGLPQHASQWSVCWQHCGRPTVGTLPEALYSAS